jgi:putative hemolysin
VAEEKADKFIDVERVLASKNPRLLKIIPGFALRYIKRILHQQEINDFISRTSDSQPLPFVKAILKEFGATVDFNGIENLPEASGCIVASNHPLGGLDALALIDAVATKRPDLKFVVNDVLLEIRQLQQVFVGVNKHGKNTSAILDQIDKLYASEIVMIIFPAGLVSRKQNGTIKDLDWKKSFITKAKKHRRNIIPVYINGRNTEFFYNFARLRTRLGIKSNIEMFYLVDEMYKQKGHHVTITFGKPVPYTAFDDSRTDHMWAQEIKEHVYRLKSDPEAVFTPSAVQKKP